MKNNKYNIFLYRAC